jgi:hypothetical protein
MADARGVPARAGRRPGPAGRETSSVRAVRGPPGSPPSRSPPRTPSTGQRGPANRPRPALALQLESDPDEERLAAARSSTTMPTCSNALDALDGSDTTAPATAVPRLPIGYRIRPPGPEAIRPTRAGCHASRIVRAESDDGLSCGTALIADSRFVGPDSGSLCRMLLRLTRRQPRDDWMV